MVATVLPFSKVHLLFPQNAKGVDPYAGRYGADAALCTAYRRLADHARMIAVCLADGAFPATR